MNDILNNLIKTCEWRNDIMGTPVCNAKIALCTKVIESSKCPVLIKFFKELERAIKENPYDPDKGNLSAYCRYLRYNVDGFYTKTNDEVKEIYKNFIESEENMANNIFENLTDEEQKNLWMYMIFNRDKIMEKTEQWTKEAEESGMTLAEYLETINPLNDKKMEDQ